MVVHTWGFVPSKPDSPWIKVELRAESGAVLRVSGIPYAAALASLARIRSALQGMNVRWPGKSLTLHVHPALRTSEMTGLDVPVALAIMAIQGKFLPEKLSRLVSHGMLGLDGETSNPEPLSTHCSNRSLPPSLIVRAIGSRESFPNVTNLPVQECHHLSQIVAALNRPFIEHNLSQSEKAESEEVMHEWGKIKGEGKAKMWLCIGAKLRLHTILAGPPGMGKSSLVRAAHALLPHNGGNPAPFLAPHPSGGVAGLLGSWRRGQPVSGAWALANQGLLFLDEFPEWPRPARESLRHIIDTDSLYLHRAEGSASWTSHAWLVAAMNLCSCGHHPERCTCDPSERRRYRRKLSAPLLERFPIQLDVGGHDETECQKSWSECIVWVQDKQEEARPKWPPDTQRLAQAIFKKDHSSKRQQRHLRILAEAHAQWENELNIRPCDVSAAFDVMWMNRQGWWRLH